MNHIQTTQFNFQPPSQSATARQISPPSLTRPPNTVRLGHLSDFHLGKPPADGVDSQVALGQWLDGFEEQQVDVLVVTGDLVQQPGDRRRLERVKARLEEAPFPYLVIPGNHDIPEPGARGPFEELFGDYPQVAQAAGVEFVLLDSMKGLPPSQRSALERKEAASLGSFSCGRVGDDQRRQAQTRLGPAPAFGRVMLVHHHLRRNAPTQTGHQEEPTAPHGLMRELDDADELLDWAHAHRVRLAFHGHKHNFWDPYQPRPGLVTLNSGTSVRGKESRPRRARIVDIWPGAERLHVHDLEL